MVMNYLNSWDYQAKTHNYRKGLTYLKNSKHKSKPNITFAKNVKKNLFISLLPLHTFYDFDVSFFFLILFCFKYFHD